MTTTGVRMMGTALNRSKPTWRSPCGRAELYLADARRILPRLPDRSVDLIFMDPPFGHRNNDGDLTSKIEAVLGKGPAGPPRPIANDGPEEANEFYRWMLAEAPRLLARPGTCCCCCCCGGGGPDPQFARWSLWMDEAAPLQFKQMVVWDKGPMGLGWHYRRSYEVILVGQMPGKCAWFDTTHRVENIIRPGDYGIRKIIPRANEHPTEKPVALPAHFIRLHSQPGQLVLDPCMGGGSTGVAAIANGRRFVGVEVDRKWFWQARRRIAAALSSEAGGERAAG